MKLKRITARVPKLYQSILFTVLATSWVSGVTFFILNTFITVEGDFGPQKHPWQFPAISIHGFAAFSMMILFGAMLASHVPLTWKIKKLRLWGLTFVSAVSLQIITGYTLYYIAGENSRIFIGYIHLVIGISLPLLLTLHILSAVKRRKYLSKTVMQTS